MYLAGLTKYLYTCQLKFLLNSYCKVAMKSKLVLLLADGWTAFKISHSHSLL